MNDGIIERMKNSLKFKIVICTLLLAGCVVTPIVEYAHAASGDFQNYEIRSIRRKFMTKTGRAELGGQGSLIMNQPFIYTLLLSGILDYHFSEMIALELGASMGLSVDKEDKRILDDEFDIKTQILRTKYIVNGGILWTPVYGKTQLPSGQLVYFDSFLHASLGMTGVDYDYAQCIPSDADKATTGESIDQPAPATFTYPTFLIGVGQKYFLDKSLAFRWDVREHAFSYPKQDGSCLPTEPLGNTIHHNITLQFGVSTFF